MHFAEKSPIWHHSSIFSLPPRAVIGAKRALQFRGTLVCEYNPFVTVTWLWSIRRSIRGILFAAAAFLFCGRNKTVKLGRAALKRKMHGARFFARYIILFDVELLWITTTTMMMMITTRVYVCTFGSCTAEIDSLCRGADSIYFLLPLLSFLVLRRTVKMGYFEAVVVLWVHLSCAPRERP
jgi:hypothetical protein